MAKAQLIARLAVEVAPSQLSSILRRRRALPVVLDTIAEDYEKEAAAVELSSYTLLRAKAPRQNLCYDTATEVCKSSVHGERFPVAGNPLPHAGELVAVIA